jgi:hypothetical protein
MTKRYGFKPSFNETFSGSASAVFATLSCVSIPAHALRLSC